MLILNLHTETSVYLCSCLNYLHVLALCWISATNIALNSGNCDVEFLG